MRFDGDFTMTIDGRGVAGGSLSVINPADETVVAEAPDASQAQLDMAVAAARRAVHGWAARLSLSGRRHCGPLGSASRIMSRH
jgi:acyl-CoA reductase-like NAD-dependent aldehyde dehydrogenase